jgi:HK97 family phage major capsid protein
MPVAEDIQKEIGTLAERAAGLLERLDKAPNGADLKAMRTDIESTKTDVADLLKEKAELEMAEEVKAMRDELEAFKAWSGRTDRKFEFGNGQNNTIDERAFTVTMYKARHGDTKAQERLADLHKKSVEAFQMEGKAIGEGTNVGGGYLVPPTFNQDLVALRRASSPMRDFVTVIGGLKSDLVYVPTQTAVETVGWVAENAMKPSTDETFSQISVLIFALAGIAKVSNQLLEDSSPAVDQIVKTSLGRGIAIEEDRAIINGTGTGQPTGILNTLGIPSTLVSATTAAAIYDDILSAIGRLNQVYFGQPDAILMAPRTWSKMLSAKDQNLRYLGTSSVVGQTTFNLPGVPNPTGAVPGAMTTIFGVPVIIDANMPVNLAGGTSAIVVGAFKEAWLLERDGFRMDMSSEAGTAFESNQTWFRGEERAGFTAARLPTAFQIIVGETA